MLMPNMALSRTMLSVTVNPVAVVPGLFHARVFGTDPGNHGSYWDPGRAGITNMAKIILGQDGVTVCRTVTQQDPALGGSTTMCAPESFNRTG